MEKIFKRAVTASPSGTGFKWYKRPEGWQYLAEVTMRAEVWRVLATKPQHQYWQRDLPKLFKDADSWLLVEYGHSARTLGECLVQAGLIKDMARTYTPTGKRTWNISFVLH